MNMPLNIDWQQILLHLLNFVILFAILYFLLYRPVNKFMEKRCEYYKNLDDDAQKNLQQSEKLKNEYAEKLRCADSEIERKTQEAYLQLSEKNEKKMRLAKQEAETIISEARKNAEAERSKILESAQREISDMVASATENLVLGATTSQSYDNFLDLAQRGEVDE